MKQLSLKQRGLTLLELLVTLTITAILASLAIPAFANTIKRTNSLTIAYQMIELVQFARSEAITRQVPVTLCGSSDGQRCDNKWSKQILIFADNNNNGAMDNTDVLLHVTDSLKTGETLTWRSFQNKSYLQLQPNGMTYYQNGNFTYCPADGDEHFAVQWILNAAGRLRLAQDNNRNGIPENSSGQDISC